MWGLGGDPDQDRAGAGPACRPFPMGPFSGVFLSQISFYRELDMRLKLALVNKFSLAHAAKLFEASGLSVRVTQDMKML